MKYRLLIENCWSGNPKDKEWVYAVSYLVDADNADEAMEKFKKQVLWITPDMNLRCDSADPNALNLGPQLWEPCERCGNEPSYSQNNGHLCEKCIRKHDHPKISTTEQVHSVEPPEIEL